MSDQPRPVWVSEEHAAYIDRYLGGFKAKWDAAPADSTEVVREVVGWHVLTDDVLRALGMPKEPKADHPGGWGAL